MREITVRDAIREAIDEELHRDDDVFILGEEVAEYNGAYKITKGMLDKYGPRRVIDTPIAEGGFTGIAVGAALTGLRPIVEYMSFNFSFVAFDQIVNNAMKMHYMSGGRFTVPIVFRGPNGAAARVSCQHSHNVEPLYAHLPGCIVIAPSTPYDSKALLKAAIRNNNPVFFLENEMLYNVKGEVPEGEYSVEIGKAKIVSEGTHLTLISYSRMLVFCSEVLDDYKKKGISIELIDLRTIKPLDVGTIVSSVKKTGRAVVVEEGHKFAGVSAEVISILQEFCFDHLDAPVERVCQMETPLPYAPPLEEETIPNTKRIKAAIDKTIAGLL
ncbi:MAG: 2-oxoisovalerate dehydrogenase subunit beta [Chlamydiia bacterium]|nr:2-oxoisovalerate dehydrogenase subunit beta [Chlamydiia bacterium]MCH9617993.1 2-oxoisovalerate dehydrogenase subunit beta [Chlamydiia bacterium]MCH9623682.1 2-oxoisovalerate dehydrogenase subunit beta [Chlamydiia bacterium]